MIDPDRYQVDLHRTVGLGKLATSLGGQAEYAAAIVTDSTGAEFPMLIKLDAVDNEIVHARPCPDIEHERTGELPIDYADVIWFPDTPVNQKWRATRRRGLT